MIANTKGKRFRATLFLREKVEIDLKAPLVAQIEELVPEFKGKILNLGLYENIRTYGIQVLDVTVTVSFSTGPKPLEEFGAAAASVAAWPGAASEIVDHKAVAVISHSADFEGVTAVRKVAKYVSIISVVVARLLPAIGLHFAPSGAMLSMRMIEELADEDLPLALWFRLSWFHGDSDPGGQPLTGVTVRGLEPFIGWELEVLPCAHDALVLEEAISKLCLSVFSAGIGSLRYAEDTVRLTDEIEMPIRHGMSQNVPNLPVLQLGGLAEADRITEDIGAQPWRRFGPDATLSGIAKWLTDNIEAIDDVFSIPEVTHIRLGESLSREHPHVEHEGTTPVMGIAFQSCRNHGTPGTQYHGGGPKEREKLVRFERALGENATSLKRHCVLREDVFFIELLDLTIWQGGVALGMVRYPGMNGFGEAPDRELAGQYFTWIRRGNRYIPQSLEIRLWGIYIPDFIREGQDELQAIARDPKTLLESHEILPGRETGYVALYQMQRSPTRIEWGTEHVSAFYDGENLELPFQLS
ncbi:hypothetical protein [Dongia sp. agr-C8]